LGPVSVTPGLKESSTLITSPYFLLLFELEEQLGGRLIVGF